MINYTETDETIEHTIVIKVPDELYRRCKKYFFDDKYKAFFVRDSMEKRVNYLESRDKLFQSQRIRADREYIKMLIEMVDDDE